MKRINNIQSLRGIAVLFVVFFHLFIVENRYSGFETIMPAVSQFGNFGVDLFFVISGFVMVTVTRGKFRNLKQSLLFLYHRVSRIYPLYWVYSLMALVVFIIRPTWVNSSQGSQVNLLESFLLLPSDKLPLVQVGWTLIHEMYFYLVFFLIFLAVSENYLYMAVFVWGALVIFLNLFLQTGNPYLLLISNPLTLEFLSGCLLAIVYYKGKEGNLGITALLFITGTSLLLAIAGSEYYRLLTGNAPPSGWWRVLLYGLPALVIVTCLIYVERLGFVLHSFLYQVGNGSYSIYLSHLFTINVVGRIWALVSVDGIIDNIIFILLTLTAVLVVGFLSYWFVENKLLDLSRKIMDNKKVIKSLTN